MSNLTTKQNNYNDHTITGFLSKIVFEVTINNKNIEGPNLFSTP